MPEMLSPGAALVGAGLGVAMFELGLELLYQVVFEFKSAFSHFGGAILRLF